MKSSVVIGANWGDEGKGLMTDYLCKKYNADLIIRFNGGAQAGHTVVTPEGKRHVFSHIGSGFFLGVPTYLSEYFILNPILFKKEYNDLSITDSYKIYISPKSEITTYWDMLANRAMEEMRGNNPHGSCGAGINTTIQRANNSLSCFNINSLRLNRLYPVDGHEDYSKKKIDDILSTIRSYWVAKLYRFSEEINKEIPDWVNDCFSRSKEIQNQFIEDLFFMFQTTACVNYEKAFFSDKKYCIFEGAQGLGLDQFYGNYPYVTRSNTGMRNVLDLQRKSDNSFSIDEIVYVSRTYETRHGYDPHFISDIAPEYYAVLADKTNIKNEWQGEIRYRRLRYDHLADRIRLDLETNNLFGLNENRAVKIAFTHKDQVPINEEFRLEKIDKRTHSVITSFYVSSGETRNDVKKGVSFRGKLEYKNI